MALSLADTSIIWLSLSDGSVTKVTINQGLPTGQNYTIPGTIQGQSPSLAVDPTNANRVVAVFAGYSQQSLPSRHVFLTSNGGANWQDISGGWAGQGVPDMPLYAAAIDSNAAPPAIMVSSDFAFFARLTWGIAGTNWEQTCPTYTR